MKVKLLTLAMTALIVGSVSVPTVAKADPPSWAPAHGWHKKKNVEKRAERAERRETRALKLNDASATTNDLNRAQVRKNDRQNRREELAEIRREQRAEARRHERIMRQQALRP